MKLTTPKVLAVILAAGMLSLSSCIDESIDLKNLSSDVQVGGNIAAPLGEMTVTIDDLINELTIDSTLGIEINERNGVVNIYFSDTLSFENPANVDLTNFGSIHKVLTPGVSIGLPVVIPVGDQTYTITETYDFNDINIDTTEQRVDSIRFTNTTIKATIETNLPPNFISIDIELPVEFEGESGQVVKMDLTGPTTTRNFTAENFIVRSEDGQLSTTFPINVIAHGDGVTGLSGTDSIAINISLESATYIAYGYFNYGENLVQDSLDVKFDLYSELPDGSMIYPKNPEFQFDLISNVGIPLKFNINELKTFETSATPTVTKSASFSGNPTLSKNITAAPNTTTTATTTVTLNNEPANGEIDELFKIKVDSISTKFGFGIKDMPINTSGQFVSSNSKIDIKLGINVPFWLDAGSVLSMTDTLKNVGNDLTTILADDNIKEAYLRLKYTNMLPMGLALSMQLMDESYAVIALTTLYEYEIKAASVNAQGEATTASEKTIDIKFDKNAINELKQTKHIKLIVTAQGYDASSQMKFRMQDWLKIKLGAYAIGQYMSK